MLFSNKRTDGHAAANPPLARTAKHNAPTDKHLYRQRHLIENAFAHTKQWRGVATRHAENVASFAAAINIHCLFMWLEIS